MDDTKCLSEYKIEEKNFVVIMVTKVSVYTLSIQSMQGINVSVWRLPLYCLPMIALASCKQTSVFGVLAYSTQVLNKNKEIDTNLHKNNFDKIINKFCKSFFTHISLTLYHTLPNLTFD